MRGSRNFRQARGGGGGGGGGVEARRPESSLDNVFFSHQLILQFTEWIQWFYYRGEEGVQLLPGGGGIQRNPYNLSFSRGGGGPDPLTPSGSARGMAWRHCLLTESWSIKFKKKTEKYHPTTTKTEKKLSPAGRR